MISTNKHLLCKVSICCVLCVYCLLCKVNNAHTPSKPVFLLYNARGFDGFLYYVSLAWGKCSLMLQISGNSYNAKPKAISGNVIATLLS